MMALLSALSMLATPVHLGPSVVRRDRVRVRVTAPPASMYPIQTPGLRPGGKNPARIELKMPLGRPVCIVGFDATSLSWLRINANALSQGGALCYAVNVPNANALQQLRQVAPKVSIAPINGEVFRMAGLVGYPALITQSGAVK